MSKTDSVEKRRHPRTDFFNHAPVVWEFRGVNVIAALAEVSVSGAFIETPEPPPAGESVRLTLEAPGKPIRALAIVSRAIKGRGMGVEFVDMSVEDKGRWEKLLKSAAPRREHRRSGHPDVASRVSPVVPPADTTARENPSPATTTASPSDRRADVRYEMVAIVDITDPASGLRTATELANIGRRGCYLKTDGQMPVGAPLRIALTKGAHSFEAEARVVYTVAGQGIGVLFTNVEHSEMQKLEKLFASHNEAIWVGDRRRRNQRIMIAVPVEVTASSPAKGRQVEKTKTISISPYGASLLLRMPVEIDERIVLFNQKTRASIECTVVYKGKTQEGAEMIGVTFSMPKREFWRIAFPPSDWSLRHPDARRNQPARP